MHVERAAIGSVLAIHHTPMSEKVSEKPDSQLKDKIKDDEVSSSQDAHKINTREESKKGTSKDQLYLSNGYNANNSAIDFNTMAPVYHVDDDNIVESVRPVSSVENRHSEIMSRFLRAPLYSPTQLNSLLQKYSVGGSEFEPAARVLVASIRWLHSMPPYVNLASNEQVLLLQASWREIFILTAAQCSFFFDVETITVEDTNRSNIFEEIRQLIMVTERINTFRLDKMAYDTLKMLILFRSESLGSSLAFEVQNIQDHYLVQLQNLCSGRDPCRLGKLLMTLASICSLAKKGFLEHLLFGTASEEDVQGVLNDLLLYTSMELINHE